MQSKSIEQLEDDIWTEPAEFPPGLVVKCHRYRKIPVDELTIEQLRLLISQKIGLQFITAIAIGELSKNVLVEGDFYQGDLLIAVSNLPTEFWSENQNECITIKNIVEQNSKLIINELGEKKFELIKAHYQKFK